jgi:SagB-type dehydrogenase family enzyme
LDTTQYVRNPALCVFWRGGERIVYEPSVGRIVRASCRLLEVLEQATESLTVHGLAERCHISHSSIAEMIEKGLLIETGSPHHRAVARWSPIELSAQRRTRRGGISRPAAEYADMPRLRRRASGSSTAIPLPSPTTVSRTYHEVASARRSSLTFSSEGVSLQAVSNVLAPAAVADFDEITARSWRGYPSASARHPLEVYVLAHAVNELTAGGYWYNPFEHTLHYLPQANSGWSKVYESLRDLAGAEQCGGYPAVALVITAVFQRTLWKYRDVGLSLVYKDAGCLTQALALAATAHGVGFKPVGGADEFENARILGLDPVEESQVGGALVGVATDPGRTGHRD